MESKTILFPTDFSERADKALDQAIELAVHLPAKLIIYHAYHRPVIADDHKFDVDDLLSKTQGKIEEKFRRMEVHHPHLKKVAHEFKKELGISVNKIQEMAEELKPDLIVMATKGAKGFGELLGSKTARTIKSVQVPVLVFPDDTGLKGIEKIGLACDYSQHTDLDHLKFLVTVAQQMDLKVEVISLNRDERTMTDREKDIRQKIRVKLEELPNSFNYTFSENIERGILDYAKNHEIGLIAIVPKSYNFMERLFHESLTTQLAFHSPIPAASSLN